MKVEKISENGKLTVKVEGKIDTITAPLFAAELQVDGVQDVTVDLTAVEYVSSAGLRVFLNAQKALLAAGGQLSIAGANESVRRIFTITGFARIIKFID